jgi:TonB-dependent receptor
MSYQIATRLFFQPARLLRTTTSLFAVLLALSPLTHAAEPAVPKGQISGTVTSKSTGNALQGARVHVSSLDKSTLTDNTGRFVLYDVPAGSVEVVVSYEGFTNATQSVDVSAGPATLAVEMQSSDVITLEKFTVSTVKEGQALSITEQRNAANVKNVTAFDEWGILPTQNVGELASRLPGITFTTDEDNLINNISIRGQPASYTRLNIDGMSSTGVGGDGRTATLHSFSGSMYEQIEVILGQTPDKRADSLGGQINLKTKSPLAMRENRRINYNVSGRYFPSFSDRNVPLGEHPFNSDISVGYTGIYSVGGGTRNLGLSFNASYQNVVNSIDYDFLQYENTTNAVANFRDYDKRSGINSRFISAFSARADYRWTDRTTVSLRFLFNAGSEPHYLRTRVNPFAGNSTIATLDVNGLPTGTGAILPGYTANRTEIRAVTGSRMALSTWDISFVSKNPTGTLVFEHDLGRLKIDHAYRWSNTHWDSGAGRSNQGGQLDSRTRDPIGFALDNSNLNGRVFTQLSGPDAYSAASYTPFVVTAANTTTQPVPITSLSYVKRSTFTDTNEVSANVNATYNLDTAVPIVLKAGFDTVNRRVNNRNMSPRRWFGVVGSVLSSTLVPVSEFERQHGGTRLPVHQLTAVDKTLGDATLWYEDVNFTAVQNYTNRRIMEEGVDAAYLQGSARIGKLTVLGGVRVEKVSTDTFTFFRARSTPIATQPDHFLRAALDYQQQTTEGSYTKVFPSIHFAYDITPNLKARASWSTSYGRPLLANIVPAITVSDASQTVTIGNPSIKPQESENIDLKLEYYFQTNGSFTVSAYRKDIKDYISSALNLGITVPNIPSNGFDGLYGGYTIFAPSNIGDAKVDGFEIDFKQRLAFLPGALKGLTFRANYTHLKTEGKFAGTTLVQGSQLAGFIPKAFNAGLQYNYGKFGASFDVNYTGKFPITNASLTSPGLNAFAKSLTTMNVGASYKIRPDATLFLTMNNFTENGRIFYTYDPARTRQLLIAPLAIKIGVTGQF